MITREQLNALEQDKINAEGFLSWHQDSGPDVPFSNTLYSEITARLHAAYMVAQEAYISASHEFHTSGAKTPQNANSGRYSGTLKWYGRYGYIHCDALVDNLRVTRSFIEGSMVIPTYTSIPVTFNILENEILGYRHASRVVITGNATSEAAYVAKTARPIKTPVQRPRSLEEHKARLAGQTRPVVVSTIPTGAGTHLVPGSDEHRAWMSIEPMSAKTASDAYDWMHEGPHVADSKQQQDIDVRSDLA